MARYSCEIQLNPMNLNWLENLGIGPRSSVTNQRIDCSSIDPCGRIRKLIVAKYLRKLKNKLVSSNNIIYSTSYILIARTSIIIIRLLFIHPALHITSTLS